MTPVAPQLEGNANKSASTNGRLEFLDCLRGVAATTVLLEHGGYLFVPGFRSFTHNVFSFGKFGLTAFFLVSGFVIPLSLEHGHTLRKFWLQRICRLYPLYWFSIMAAVVLYMCGYKDAVTPSFPTHLWRNVLINLSMFQEFIGIPHAIGLYYTLSIELAFYIACSILFKLKRLGQTMPIAWILLVFVFALSSAAPLFIHRRIEMAGVFYGLTLFVGTAIYRFHIGQVSRRSLSALLLGVVAVAVSGIRLNYVVLKKADPLEHYNFFSVAASWLLAYFVFYFLYSLRGFRFPKAFVWLGRVSYSLYLLHALVLVLFANGKTETFGLVRFFLFAATSIGVASITFLTVEEPFIKMGRRLSKRATALEVDSMPEISLIKT